MTLERTRRTSPKTLSSLVSISTSATWKKSCLNLTECKHSPRSPSSYHFNSISRLFIQASFASVLCFMYTQFLSSGAVMGELKQFVVVKHVNGRMYGIKMRSQGSCCVIGRCCRGLLWTDSYLLLHIWCNVIRHLNC